jgi:hypothetical protein
VAVAPVVEAVAPVVEAVAEVLVVAVVVQVVEAVAEVEQAVQMANRISLIQWPMPVAPLNPNTAPSLDRSTATSARAVHRVHRTLRI